MLLVKRLIRDGYLTVHHFWYNTWPDHGVPTKNKKPNASNVLRMLEEIEKLRMRMRQQQCGGEQYEFFNAALYSYAKAVGRKLVRTDKELPTTPSLVETYAMLDVELANREA